MIRTGRTLLTSMALLSALVAPARAADADPERFALVVGNNTPPHAGLATLRYADDDALRWAGLLSTFGTEVEVLTTLDAETSKLVGAEAPRSHAPTHAELRAAMARLAGDVKRAKDTGHRTVFFFVYAGHGDVDQGEGFVTLADGPFRRSDLENEVLALSAADTNHVIVDACRSAYLAYDRGPGGTRRPWTEPYFGASAGARFRNTGFLLANSTGGASHEWEEFQSGIFSHELRSGLLGGADADHDGRITYRELSAFVRVANQAVRNEKFRPTMLALAPRDGDDVVVDLSRARGGRVHFGLGRGTHHYLEDALGVRWADIHPGETQDVTLVLPATATARLYLRPVDAEAEYALDRDASVELATLTTAPARAGRRGALSEAFATLFASPFDAGALAVPEAAPCNCDQPLVAATPPAKRTHRALEATLATAGLASFVVSGVLLVNAAHLRDSTPVSADGATRLGVNDQIDTRNHWAIGTAVFGALLGGAAAALWYHDRATPDAEAR